MDVRTEIQEKDRQIQELLADMALFPEMNPGPVCRMDRDGMILLANTAAKKFFHSDTLAGNSWLELCPGMTLQTWKKIRECKKVFPFEAELDDSYMVFNHTCPENSEFIFVYGTDITANKQIERKLEEQRKIVTEIARFPDMNPGPVLRLDYTSTILLSNAKASEVFGGELSGKRWKEICPGMTNKIWVQILSTTKVIPVESKIGETIYVFNHRHDDVTKLVFVYGTDITLQRAAERSLRQSEKMATLGTLAAGIAHELNNPAAAMNRAAIQLQGAFKNYEQTEKMLQDSKLSDAEMTSYLNLKLWIEQHTDVQSTLTALTRLDQEAAVEDWLEAHSVSNPWEIASEIVMLGISPDYLDSIALQVRPQVLGSILIFALASVPVYSLTTEINEGSKRISEIVTAMKSYSYLDQAPIQNINIHEGINSTLVILRSKLSTGITINREFATDLPAITAYGSELNQVWTHLIDNAVDAMGGKGEITIRTKREGNYIAVEIEDTGPGIPTEIQSRVFDPFFTTKPPGKGTGLGLATTYGILTEKHKGQIHLRSRPGCTVFTVLLPIESQNVIKTD